MNSLERSVTQYRAVTEVIDNIHKQRNKYPPDNCDDITKGVRRGLNIALSILEETVGVYERDVLSSALSSKNPFEED